jgi:peroxiredoxin
MSQTLEEFSIGKKAPEITGSDVDGKTFTLSEYHGKVLVHTKTPT